MIGLPCLLTVRAGIDEQRDLHDILPLDKDWKCVGLRSLRLNLRNVHGSIENGCMGYVFLQIGKLRSLEELGLESELDMYRKKHGYLEQLAGLKQIKILDLSNTNRKELGDQEAFWISENWPKLLQVR